MNWIFLSPHLDDAAYSCGGLVWQRSSVGERVAIWTIFAGDPPETRLSAYADSIHKRWDLGMDSITRRRNEDIDSCRILNAAYQHFQIPDAIYRFGKASSPADMDLDRSFLYQDDGQLFGTIHPEEKGLEQTIGQQLIIELEKIPQFPHINIVCPLGLGNHVDHKITRKALEQLNIQLLYYADFPYVLENFEKFDHMLSKGWNAVLYQINLQALKQWQMAAAAHKSQINTFWENVQEMCSAIEFYLNQRGGIEIWQPPNLPSL